MQTYTDFFATQLTSPTVLAIGSFDGVHRGHEKLLRRVMERAHQHGAQSAVITLHPHPKIVLGRDPNLQLILTLEERIELLGALGLDKVIVYPFDERTSHLTAREFVHELVARIKMVEVVCTQDFGFGYKRQGNVALLEEMGGKLGFGVTLVEPETNGGEKISSTRVREFIAQGKIAEATHLLGRSPSVRGIVVEGDHRGRRLGFPTANLELPPRKLFPANGIYATRVKLNDEWFDGATSVGVRPTFYDQGRRLVEAHLLDFNRDIYGQTIEVHFVERLRDELKFDSVDALVEQMRRDCEQARQVLARVNVAKPLEFAIRER